MAKKLKIWNGTTWEDVAIALPTSLSASSTNTFSANQIVDTSSSVAALRITQRGTGEALRVEDEANPDSSPFVIDAAGSVGIGTSTPQQKLSVTGNIHMNGGTGTGISWAADQSSHYLKFDSTLNGIKLQGYAGVVFETLGQNERMRIDASGNVGIGNSNPAYKLDLASAGASATVGNQSLFFRSIASSGNQDMLQLYSERTLAGGLQWGTQDWILRRHVDITPMGGFRWAAGDWNVRAIYGTPTTPSVRTSHISTSAPTGGIDGDIWLVYTA